MKDYKCSRKFCIGDIYHAQALGRNGGYRPFYMEILDLNKEGEISKWRWSFTLNELYPLQPSGNPYDVVIELRFPVLVNKLFNKKKYTIIRKIS